MLRVHPKDLGLALQRTVGRRRKDPKPKTPEAVLQAQVEEYAALRHIECFHLPAAMLAYAFGRRNLSGPELGALRVASDAIKGFPDVILFNPKTEKFKAMELKSAKGKMSHAQVLFKHRLGTIEVRDFETAKVIIDGMV